MHPHVTYAIGKERVAEMRHQAERYRSGRPAEANPAAGRGRPLRLQRRVVLPLVALVCLVLVLVLAFVPPAVGAASCRQGLAGKPDLVSLP